jgi:hypothetical protein
MQIGPDDTLIVGWENELASDELAFSRTYSRTAQLEQWAFMGAPGASRGHTRCPLALHPPAVSQQRLCFATAGGTLQWHPRGVRLSERAFLPLPVLTGARDGPS